MTDADRYNQRGVSADKKEVHDAVKNLDHGLYPTAFCKIYPDIAGDPNFCSMMSSDGSGTKSILAYLYGQETGDFSVWRGISQDAIVMNMDDLACVGAANNFMLTSIVNRNPKRIDGDILAQLIKGSAEFVEAMHHAGVNITFMGGETADLPDIVRTATVDATMSARMERSKLILTKNIQAGDVIVGLASYGQATYETTYNSGISSNGLTSARHDVLSSYYKEKYPETYEDLLDPAFIYVGKNRLTDTLDGTPLTIGQAILSPTRTFVPVINKIQQEMPGLIHGIINNTGGGATKVLHYVDKLAIYKNNMLPVPPLFQLIQEQSNTNWKEMFKVFNCGTRMDIYLDEKHAQQVIDISKSFNIDAQIIGYVADAEKKEVHVKTPGGVFQYE